MAREIEIVGAGLAGLVAGINLVRRGFGVRVYETRQYMGGDLSYADSTLMNIPTVESELGVEVEEALEPWTLTRAWAYGRKYEFGLPRGVEGFTVERGKGERSLENVLYRQAVEEGVEVQLGRRLSKREIKARAQSLINELEKKGALVYIPRSDKDYTVEVGLRMLTLRHLVQEEKDQFRAAPGEINVLQYYVNAISHYI